MSLVIRRPPHFAFKPGDYIFINIPAIATFEWHPFTISSAPEQSDVISLHIRVVGHWTNKLYEYFEAEQKRLQCKLQGGPCEEPESKYESFHRTMMAAREKVRKASTASRKSSAAIATIENNNQGFVNYAATIEEDPANTTMSETEKNLRQRMKKRSAMMRYEQDYKINFATLDYANFLARAKANNNYGQNCYCRQREAEMEEQHDHNSSTEDASITRNFRYMRRKPTIISYRPPQGIRMQT